MSKQYDTIDFTRKFAQITPGFSEDLTTNSIIKTFLEEMKGYMGKDYLLLMPYFSSLIRSTTPFVTLKTLSISKRLLTNSSKPVQVMMVWMSLMLLSR